MEGKKVKKTSTTKKVYEEPKMTIIKLSEKDIITTSAETGVTLPWGK